MIKLSNMDLAWIIDIDIRLTDNPVSKANDTMREKETNTKHQTCHALLLPKQQRHVNPVRSCLPTSVTSAIHHLSLTCKLFYLNVELPLNTHKFQ